MDRSKQGLAATTRCEGAPAEGTALLQMVELAGADKHLPNEINKPRKRATGFFRPDKVKRGSATEHGLYVCVRRRAVIYEHNCPLQEAAYLKARRIIITAIDDTPSNAATWLRARKRTVADDRDHDLAGYEKIDGQPAATVLPTEAEAFYAEARLLSVGGAYRRNVFPHGRAACDLTEPYVHWLGYGGEQLTLELFSQRCVDLCI